MSLVMVHRCQRHGEFPEPELIKKPGHLNPGSPSCVFYLCPICEAPITSRMIDFDEYERSKAETKTALAATGADPR